MKNIFIALIIILLLALIGCSGVKTTKQIIGQEVAQIEQWELFYVPDVVQENGSYADIKQPDSLFKKEFLNLIQSDLLGTYEVRFYDNVPSLGKIVIDLNTSSNFKFKDTKYDVIYFNEQDRDAGSDIIVEPLVMHDKSAPVGRIEMKRKIIRVDIYAYNLEGHLIGEISLRGQDIKPKHISKVIYSKIMNKNK